MEALQQRHDELVKRHKEAVGSADAAKARRMDRLVKVCVRSCCSNESKEELFHSPFTPINSNTRKRSTPREKVARTTTVN